MLQTPFEIVVLPIVEAAAEMVYFVIGRGLVQSVPKQEDRGNANAKSREEISFSQGLGRSVVIWTASLPDFTKNAE